MAGKTSNISFVHLLRDTGPARPLYFRQQIPQYVHILADHGEGARPGATVESNEINNAGGVYVSYRSGNNIITYPSSWGYWSYTDPNFYN